MTSSNDIYQNRVIALLGTQLSNGVKDFGKIVDFVKITENMGIRYVFITDTGRKIDAGSAMRFIQAYRRKLSSAPDIVFPDGSDTVMKRRTMRVRRSGMHSVYWCQYYKCCKIRRWSKYKYKFYCNFCWSISRRI